MVAKKYKHKESEYNKTYYEKNKDKFMEKYNQPVRCETCDLVLGQMGFKRHLLTKKHINNMKDVSK